MESTRRIALPPSRGAWTLFVVALVLRLAAILVLDSPADADKGPYGFGFEAGCLAQSLHEGRGYAGPWTRAEEPWNLGSGPSAWLPPAYPGLLACLLDLGGGLDRGSAALVFVVQGFVAAATCVALWALGVVLGAARAGQLAGWCLAFYPAAIWNAAHTVWDTTLTAFVLTAFLWALFAFGARGVRAWAALGLAFGALLLVNPAPLSLAPVVLWIAGRERASLARRVARLGVFTAVAFVVLLPWLMRNQSAVGAFALRTNLGVELHVGNNDEGTGRFQLGYHPSNSAREFLRYRELGEVAYSAWALGEARRWIAENPTRFAELTLRRAQIFWIGDDPFSDPRRDAAGRAASSDWKSWVKWLQHLGFGVAGLAGAVLLARRGPDGRALLAILLLFPVAYYVTHFMERYRYPIEPLLVLGAAVLVLALLGRRREPSRT